MGLSRTSRRAGRRGSLDTQHFAIGKKAPQPGHHERKRTHIVGLFLDPDHLPGFGMTVDFLHQFRFRPGIELFYKDYACGAVLVLGALNTQLVTDLAAADQETVDLLDLCLRQNRLKARSLKGSQWRAGVRIA